MLIAVLLIIGKDWKKPKCLATRYELKIVGVFIKVKCYIEMGKEKDMYYCYLEQHRQILKTLSKHNLKY